MGTPTFQPIANITLASTASTVTFSGISQGFRDLVLIVSGLITTTVVDATTIQFNGDTASNYYQVLMTGDGTSATSASGNFGSIYAGISNNSDSISIINIMDYSAADKHKSVISRGNSATGARTRAVAGRWANNSPITSIVVSNVSTTFAAGSTFNLYGVIA